MIRSNDTTTQLANLKSSLKQKSTVHDARVIEFIKCKQNPFYFIFNYVYIEETGGKLKLNSNIMHNKVRRVVKSLFLYHKCVFMASRQLGKALDINTPIPQPNGKWTTMGNINVGDIVLDKNGNPTTVIAATDIMYNHKCYKLEFDYAEPIIADEDHLWEIGFSPLKIKNTICNTKQIQRYINSVSSNSGNPFIYLNKKINNSKKKFLIDPYLLGLWLGDGSKSASRITICNDDYEDIFNILKSKKITIKEYKRKIDAPNSGYFDIYNLISRLKKINVFENKHIPRNYFSGSFKQRLQLLRGLMDSNGNCLKKGDCEFYQKDLNFIKQVQELLSSLGIKSRIKDKIINSETYYTIKFCTRNFYVFNLKRKRELQKKCLNHIKNYKHFIKSVTEVESVPVRCIQVDSPTKIFLAGESMIPTHNSTIAACLLTWVMLFYPRIECVILNMKQNAALKNLARIKFIWDNLPDWMKIPRASKSDIKTYFELRNGSRTDVYYPSAAHDPSTLARSLTIPVLYIDEAAFIRHMEKIYGSAQQTLSKAREQAIKNNYPFFQLITSTPNGIYGDGEWFYKRYNNAVDSDELFEINDLNGFEDWRTDIDVKKRINDPSKNSFIKVKFHWSEDPTKDERWYQTQCQELDDERLINQELDLIFVGSTRCIFPDNILSQFKARTSSLEIDLKHQVEMRVFKENLNPLDFYLIGVDSASSVNGAFDSIEIFSYSNFEQVAEINVKLGSLTAYGELVDDVFKWLYKLVGERIKLCIENNSIGKAIIEHLLLHVKDFNYIPFIYKEEDKDEYGISTNARTKELMIAILYQYIKEDPSCIKSDTLIAQLATIERTNSGVKSSSYSDLFMACCFCAYVRKQTFLEIMPLLDITNEKIQKDFVTEISDVAKYTDPKTKIKEDLLKESFIFVNDELNNETSGSELFPLVLGFNDKESDDFFNNF